MSEAYQRICAERCEWCAKGVGKPYIDTSRHLDRYGLMSAYTPDCTAPTPEQFIEEQAAELAKAKQDTERLDWLDSRPFTAYRERDIETRNLSTHFVVVDEDAPGSRRGILGVTIREAIDAARDEKRGFCGTSAGKS